MKKYLFLFFLSSLLISKEGSAQASLGISQYTYTIYNDTVLANTPDSIAVFVVNKGTAPFNGPFEIIASVQDSGSTSYHRVDTSYSVLPVSLPPGDSIPYMLQPYYEMGDSATYQYHYNINVIVIWPVAMTASTFDSLTFNIFILLPLSVKEIDPQVLIRAYPNPSTDNITLESGGKNSIEEVRIYDTQGRLIDQLIKPGLICVEAWAPGTYIIHIQLGDGKTHTVRVIKQ